MPHAIRRVLKSQSGAFDMLSTLVAAVAIAVLVGGAMTNAFGVIPWAQDIGSKQDLAAIRTAQSTMKVRNGTFGDLPAINASGYMTALPSTAVIESDGETFCATVASASGKSFRLTSSTTEPVEGNCTKTTVWTKTASPAHQWWRDAAISRDGRTMAMSGQGVFTISRDGGQTWSTPAVPAYNYSSLSMSADGKTILYADNSSAQLWLSKDSGLSWAAPAMPGSSNFRKVFVSPDGSGLIALDSYIWTSPDGGSTWKRTTGNGAFYMYAWASTDGSQMIIMDAGGNMSTSTNKGATWTTKTGNPVYNSIGGLSASDDGKVIVIGSSNNYHSTSRDSGATWTEQTGPGKRVWVSPDGSTVIRSYSGSGRIVVSKDSGLTWVADTILPSGFNWNTFPNADGTRMIAYKEGTLEGAWTSVSDWAK